MENELLNFNDDEYYSHGIELTENETKSLAYLDGMSAESFDALYPEEANDDESAEELKVLFDVGFAFARRALTNRRKKRSLLRKDGETDDFETKTAPCWDGYVRVGMKEGRKGKMVPNCIPEGQEKSFFLAVEEEVKSAEKKLKDPKGGLTAAGRAHFNTTEGANLKPGVKGAANTPEKMRRKGSFLTRFFTNPSGPMKDEKGRPTRLALSAVAWGEPVPKNAEDAARLAEKGRNLLERYKNIKGKSAEIESERKALGPTIGATSGPAAEGIDHDSDGFVFDGTPQETRAKYKKSSDSNYEKQRRKFVKAELARQGIKRNRRVEDRSKEERDARARARAAFDKVLRDRQGKPVADGLPKGPKYPGGQSVPKKYPPGQKPEYKKPEKPRDIKPADRYPDPEKKYPPGQKPSAPTPRDQRPADRYPNPEKKYPPGQKPSAPKRTPGRNGMRNF
jgi:hypothetical protein